MNLLISFMLVFATYYRFGTACKYNRVEFHNQLGPGIFTNTAYRFWSMWRTTFICCQKDGIYFKRSYAKP
ncbi:hypothetical protein Bca101_066132 [Brassica carinata]